MIATVNVPAPLDVDSLHALLRPLVGNHSIDWPAAYPGDVTVRIEHGDVDVATLEAAIVSATQAAPAPIVRAPEATDKQRIADLEARLAVLENK